MADMGKDLVVGAGISGAVIARLSAEAGNEVHVIEKKHHVAGNCFDRLDSNDIMVHVYGSHIFHTSNKDVWDFLRRFVSFNTYMHEVVGIVDGIETHIPFNFNTLYDVFPTSLASRLELKLLSNFKYGTKVPILEFMKQDDDDLKFLADYVYNNIFLQYTMKQWGTAPDGVDGAVTARVPVYLSKDNRYFQDRFQGIPLDGYTVMIERMLSHPLISVSVDTEFDKSMLSEYDRVFHTGSIDEFMDYKYGVLPYRSVRFEFEEYSFPYYQSHAAVNYPNNYDFTRIHEFKHYLNNISDKTVIAKEYSEDFVPGKNERYYPVPKDDNVALYNKYLEDVGKEYPNVHFLGRLGDYKYYDMDKAVYRAIDLFTKL